MIKNRWFVTLTALCALLAGSTSIAGAQGVTTGSIAGVVTDASGAPVEGAQVQIVNRSTGATVNATTRENGRYTVIGLDVGGPYSVTLRRIGFQPTRRDNLTIALGQTARADIQLVPQATALSGVTVTAATDNAVISPTKTGVGTSISDSTLRRLPSLDRNFTDFVALAPQVSTTLSNGGLSGGGVNNRFNQIQIDGSSETDLFGLGSTGQPGGQAGGKSIGIESVKEYQILLSPFDVRQGNFSGLLVNAVTKSGTNDFHGSAYFYGRNQAFTRSQSYINDYSKQQFGFTLGGPIIKDKVLFFINPEFQRLRAPATGFALGSPGTTLSQGTVDRFTSLLQGYGIPPGSAGSVTNQNPLNNVFGRLDISLPFNSTLIVRDNYGKATSDVFSRGSTGSAPNFPLTSNGYRFTSNKNNVGAQLRTHFGNGGFNEFLGSYTTIRDRRAPNAFTPQITVTAPGEATLIAGGDRYSQANELDQDITELTDNLTYPIGSHSITIGAQTTFYKVRNLFAQARLGVWTFGNLDSLATGQANQYIVGVPQVGDGAVRFRAQTYAAYAEDLWNVTQNLNLTYGLRVDVPRFNNRPPTNPTILAGFGRNTSNIPSGNLQYSPRIGFNWDVTGDQRNQLRGGVGAFTGHPAYVWLSNAFQNSGLTGVSLLTCNAPQRGKSGDVLPQFNSSTVQNPPAACGTKTAAAGGEIDLLSSNLRFPQDMRASLGYDRSVGHSLVATFEGLYTRALYAPFYQNLALAGPQGVDRNGRVLYGAAPFQPVLAVAGRNTVLDITNQNKDYSYNLTAGLQRRFLNNWSGSLFYTFSRVRDVQSLTSSTAYSNYRFGRRVAGDESRTNLGRSDFEQPHRIVAQGTYAFPTKTDVSLVYIGSSGTPFDYIYSSDINADGFSLNDPIYIPKDATDPNEILFSNIVASDKKTVLYTAAQQATAFNQFIQQTPCLRDNRGRIMGRDACRAPWSNVMNISVRQSLSAFRAQNLSLQLDVFNFLNLLNGSWGRQASTYSDVTLLQYTGLNNSKGSLLAGSANETQPLYQFTPGQQGFNYRNLESNYQAQLSVRYSF